MEVRIEKHTLIALSLLLIGVVLRLVPHVPNFAPIGAIALFGGATLHRRIALWLPLVIMALSDLVIGFYPGMLFTWSAFLLVGLCGMALRRQPNRLRIPLGAAASAVVFFVVSNFGVWIAGNLYPLTMQGLIDCYTKALPFFRATALSDAVYTFVLFGTYALAAKYLRGTLVVWRRKPSLL